MSQVRVAPTVRRNRTPRGRVVRVVVGRPLTEHELVERARRGDADAFGELVRVHEEIAFRTAALITGNAVDAQDAAQDGFVKAYRGLSRFRAGEPLRPWLLTIVANEARNLRRSGARRTALALRAAGEERSSGEAAPSPETALLAGERQKALLEGLARLREPDRVVIGCRYLLELSEAETAAALGVAHGTVKSRLSRALERLREEVGRDG